MSRFALLAALTCTALPVGVWAQEPPVYRVAITGSIEPGLRQVVTRAVEQAERQVGVLLLEFDSPGGRLDIAEIVAGEVEATEVPVYALITTQACGAAALVAFAADSIFMEPKSRLGAGAPPTIDLSGLAAPAQRSVREQFRRAIERRGLDPRLGEAMIDPTVSIPEAGTGPGPLTLGPEAALRLGIAAAQVGGIDELLARLRLPPAQPVTVAPDWNGTTVEVTNHNWRDVRILVLRGATPFRLGNVSSMRTEAFQIPAASVGPGSRIRVRVEVIGSPDVIATEEIRVEAGLVIQWTLEDPLSYSNYFFYYRN